MATVILYINDKRALIALPGLTYRQPVHPGYFTPGIITPGKYYFRLQVADGSNILLPSCRVASEKAVVEVNSLPVITVSNNGPVCEGTVLTLSATGGDNYSWSGPGNYSSALQSPVISGVSLNNQGLYHVKVTSAVGCSALDSTPVVINIKPGAGAGSNLAICRGAGTMLNGTGTNATSFLWTPAVGLSDPASASPLATPSETTLYTLTVSDGICKDSASVLVTVIQRATANAGPDKAIVGNQTTRLDGEITGPNTRYFWTPNLYISSDTALSPEVSPPNDVRYILHAISSNGCGEDTDTVLVKYFKAVYIPNAFTPNNDGLNDHWSLPALSAFPLAEVKVYNRYGELVFYNKGNTIQWDGTFKGIPQSSGVYTFVIDLKNGLKKLPGIVMLIR